MEPGAKSPGFPGVVCSSTFLAFWASIASRNSGEFGSTTLAFLRDLKGFLRKSLMAVRR